MNTTTFTLFDSNTRGEMVMKIVAVNKLNKLNSPSIYFKSPLDVNEIAGKINGLSNLLILALKL